MKVEINIDESQMKEVLEKEIKEMPKEVIREVVIESIKGYFSANDYENTRELFMTEDRWDKRRVASPLMCELVKGCDTSGVQEIVDKAIEDIKGDVGGILRDVIKDFIVGGMMNQYSFQSALDRAITESLISRQG